MRVAMGRLRRSLGVALLLAVCGMAMLAALFAIYASTSLSTNASKGKANAAEAAISPAVEPEAFKFREGIDPHRAAEINAAVPESSEPIQPARSFAILSPSAAGPTQLSAVDCLTAAIYYEAASESLTGQRAVAQVVLNRVRHPAYPNSVCGVVFQGSQRSTGCQFTFTCDGSLRRRPSAGGWLRARSVAAAALSGHVEASVGYATHYHTLFVVPYWSSSLTKLRTVGSHIFYRWSGGSGMPGAFVSRYANVESIPPIASANLSGYLLGASATIGTLDLAASPAAETSAAIAPPSSGLIPQSGGALSSAAGSVMVTGGGGLAISGQTLKSDVAEHRLVDDRPRMLERN